MFNSYSIVMNKSNNLFSFSYYCFFICLSKLQCISQQFHFKASNVLNDYKERQRRSAAVARTIYNISFGVIVLVVGLIMIFLDKINNETLNEYLGYLEPLLRYMFGGLCLIYGIFRLYRGLKKDF